MILERLKMNIPESEKMEAEEVRDLLETLIGEDRLDAKAIKNIPKGETTVNAVAQVRRAMTYTAEVAVDEVNTTFTVSTRALYIVSDGITYREGHGFTRSNKTIVMEKPPTYDIFGTN
jgi:hypothetical protein